MIRMVLMGMAMLPASDAPAPRRCGIVTRSQLHGCATATGNAARAAYDEKTRCL
jgi:hypothetical protein